MKVVFLDRDGTIIVDPIDERVDKVSKIELFPDTIKSLKYLKDNDFSIIFIANQAGIAEDKITEQEFWNIHEEVLKQITPSGVNILKTYMNAEAAGPNASDWRKPGPKMLTQAATDFNLNPSDIYMIGDSESDIKAAINAGCKGGVLVETARNSKVVSSDAVYSAPCLLDAVKFVVSRS
jgi:imidazoleglycerol-phosphate dehydratase/histidinol-phosphatase